MVIKNALIMHLGDQHNHSYLTKECILNSIDTFIDKPISWHDDNPYNCVHPIIGYIIGNIHITDNEVRADINIKDEHIDKWTGKYSGWCLQPNIRECKIDLSCINVGGK